MKKESESHIKKPDRVRSGLIGVGTGRFELPASTTPKWRANRAALRSVFQAA